MKKKASIFNCQLGFAQLTVKNQKNPKDQQQTRVELPGSKWWTRKNKKIIFMSFMSNSQDQKEPVSLIRSTIREPFFYPSIAPFYFAGSKINQWPGRFLVRVWNRATGPFEKNFSKGPVALFQTRTIKAETQRHSDTLQLLRAKAPKNVRIRRPWFFTVFKKTVQLNCFAAPKNYFKGGPLGRSSLAEQSLKQPSTLQRSSSVLGQRTLRAAAKSKGTNSYLIPDFVEIQRKSFFQLLENGLIEEFAKRNPITNKHLEIFFYPEYYQLTPPEYNPRRAILLSKSYSSKLFIPAQLTDKKLRKSQLKWVLIGNLPLMTKRGHFVLNGAPRVIVNQILRSPGIYFQGSLKEIFSDQWSEKAEITYKRFYTDLICLRGTWLRIEIDKNKDVWAQMKKVPKIPLLWFLLAMGLTERIIFKSVINPTRLLANFNPEIKRKIDYEYVTNASDAWKEISNLISSSNKESYAALSPGLLKESSEATLEGKKQPPYITKKKLLPSSFFPKGDGLLRTASAVPFGEEARRESSPLFYKVKSAIIFSAKNQSKLFKKSSFFNFEVKKRAFGASPKGLLRTKQPLVIQGGLPTQLPLLGRSERFPFAFDKALPNQNQPLPLRQKGGQKAKKGAASSSLGSFLRTAGKTARSSLHRGPCLLLPLLAWRSKHGRLASCEATPSCLAKQAPEGRTSNRREAPVEKSTQATKRSSFLNIVEHSKEGRNWIFKRFMNPRAYDLGGQGRLNFNRKLGLSIDSNQTTLTAQDLLFATDYLFKVEKGLKNIDDIDHLKNRRVRTSGELLQIQIGIGLVRLEKIIREKLSKINAQTRASDFLTLTTAFQQPLGLAVQGRISFAGKSKVPSLKGGSVVRIKRVLASSPKSLKTMGTSKNQKGALLVQAPLGGGTKSAQTEEFKMNNLINTKAFNGALREFFGSSQLSQFMDQLNPLAEITHKRRLSSMGPGGVTRDSATLAIRGIHPTHYGRICPIETPEGKTVGLTNSLTTYARANPQGFLESPFYKVYKGQIQKSAGMFFLTAGQEENTKIAAADVGGGGAFGRMDFLPKNKIPAKIAYGDTISKISRDQVEYIGVSPIQMISIATSLIPFVEHDDANRALMGSNMQRQAVPLVRAERPLVGTGLESRTVSDSGHAVVARESGYVAYVSAKKMIIYAIPIHS